MTIPTHQNDPGLRGGHDSGPSVEIELPLLISIERAGRELGIGRTLVYELLAAQRLPSVKIGRRRFVRREELLRFVRDLPVE
jgi:excisionase family DNA binding protein